MLPKLAIDLLQHYLEEDVRTGDSTTEAIPEIHGLPAVATIFAQSRCVLAGVEEVLALAELVGARGQVLAREGEWVGPSQPVITIQGSADALLRIERVALNIMMRMSGIATKTRAAVNKARAVNPHVRVAATRKTTPGFRFFEKRAVKLGGGDPHRYALDDMVLIKNNHIALAGGVRQAVEAARVNSSFSKKISCEAREESEAIEAIRAGADIVLLDNLTASEIEQLIQSLEELGIRECVLLEASGGINESNIEEYARTGVDIISLGALTHSFKSADFNMRIDKQ